MIAADTLEVLRTVAAALGELRDEAMFVGGAITGFLVTNSAPQRETDDVDLSSTSLRTRTTYSSPSDYARLASPRMPAKAHRFVDGRSRESRWM